MHSLHRQIQHGQIVVVAKEYLRCWGKHDDDDGRLHRTSGFGMSRGPPGTSDHPASRLTGSGVDRREGSWISVTQTGRLQHRATPTVHNSKLVKFEARTMGHRAGMLQPFRKEKPYAFGSLSDQSP
jgi:hypothetical protein